MKFEEQEIEGVYEITLAPRLDSRGFFMRTYDKAIFKAKGLDKEWLQENHSRSEQKGIIRGLHFQRPPFAETKLVRCTEGAVLDVFVDLRKGSETFGKWGSVKLSAADKNMVFIPRGFAHGFCTLTEFSEVMYKVDNTYHQPSELGLIWNDGVLNIDWPVNEPILSEKDQKNLSLEAFRDLYEAIEV